MQELQERLAGRNKDDLSYIHQGLAELTRQWNVVAADCKAAARDAQKVRPYTACLHRVVDKAIKPCKHGSIGINPEQQRPGCRRVTTLPCRLRAAS